MCASIGVDPLASGKGFWSNMLDIGDFYYELAVQIVEVPHKHLDLSSTNRMFKISERPNC